MKVFLPIVLTLGLIPISLITMIYGWGLEPQNWGWITLGYVWMIGTPIIVEAMK